MEVGSRMPPELEATSFLKSQPLRSARGQYLKGLTAQLGVERRVQAVDGDANLSHAIAVAYGHLIVLERLEVDCDAEGCPDLVLPAIAPADALSVIILPYCTIQQRRSLL